MGQIDLRIMEAASQEFAHHAAMTLALQQQIVFLMDESRRIYTSAQQQNQIGSGEEFEHLPAGGALRQAAEILEREARSLDRACETLGQVLDLYRKAERQARDIFDGEYAVVPRTEFGTSHFENLQPYELLIPISGADWSNADTAVL